MSIIAERNIPFSPPDITEAEINEVVDALKSGWITTGVGVILTTKLRFDLPTNDCHLNSFYSNMHKAVA